MRENKFLIKFIIYLSHFSKLLFCTLCRFIGFCNSPIARSTICGENLVFNKKSLELAAKYVTRCMHHLQGHWFWKEIIEPLSNTPIHIIFRSRLSLKIANPCNGRIEIRSRCCGHPRLRNRVWRSIVRFINHTLLSYMCLLPITVMLNEQDAALPAPSRDSYRTIRRPSPNEEPEPCDRDVSTGRMDSLELSVTCYRKLLTRLSIFITHDVMLNCFHYGIRVYTMWLTG